MSTAPPSPQPSAPPAASPPQEIRIISHCTLFYWWPVWAIGAIMGLLTLFDGTRVAVIPDGAEARRSWRVEKDGEPDKMETREGYLLPPFQDGKTSKHILPDKEVDGRLPKPEEPHLHMAKHSSYGVLFATVLLLVITITNVPLRGLWSVIVIIVILLLVLALAYFQVWDKIFATIGLLDIRINAGGYFFISGILFLIWLVVTLVFDRQVYMIFTPGQFRVCQEVGGGESTYDTMGMVIQKQRDDLFRHVILGLGSGDLIVRTSGANTHEFHMPNVLFINSKLQMIEQMQADRPVVKGTI